MGHPLDVPFPGKDTGLAVKGLSDEWTVIGPIRITQHLANVWHKLEPRAIQKSTANSYRMNDSNMFGPMYLDHDWTTWAAESFSNYSWLYFYALDLCDEYLVRFGSKAAPPVQHGIKKMLAALECAPDSISEEVPWSEPTFAKNLDLYLPATPLYPNSEPRA